MASYNKITIVGNVGGDPQLKAFEQTKVAEFSVAVSESYTDRTGQRMERTDWFRCGVWGNRADVIMNYVKKGSQIMIEGRLTVRTWEDPTTKKDRFSLDIRVSDFVLLGNREQSAARPPAGAPTGGVPVQRPTYQQAPAAESSFQSPSTPYPSPSPSGAPDMEDDLPF